MKDNTIIILQDKLQNDDFTKEILEADLAGELEAFTETALGEAINRKALEEAIAKCKIHIIERPLKNGVSNGDKCWSCGAVGTLETVDPSSIIGMHEPWRQYCTKCGRLQ